MNANTLKRDLSVVAIPAFVVPASGVTDAVLAQPATFTIDVAGTGYTAGEATMVLTDGNTITVMLTVGGGGQIAGLTWVSGYSTSASDAAVVAVVQAGGTNGTAHVATYTFAASPTLIDFGPVMPFYDDLYSVSFRTVTEHDTSPGVSKTVTANLYWSDVLVSANIAPALLAARKVAATALTLTNTVDTTQYAEAVAATVPKARFLYLTFTTTALTTDSSFTIEARVNKL